MPQPSTATRPGVRSYLTTAISADPVDGTTEPHFILSPTGPGGEPCVGFGFVMQIPSGSVATFPSNVATVTPWIWMSTMRIWSPFGSNPGYVMRQYYVCFDVTGGAKIYFQVAGASADGLVEIGVDSLP